ncbi:MAG TPA: FtsX-like permease family protein [Acidimicrobiales bacterium]|nr:FtsX-like permease family protein [Acidimicrobiales bacterium]
MTAIRVCARTDLRARWRSAVLLVLLVGLAGGAAMAAAAGARRTTSAIPRLSRYVRAADAYVQAPPDALGQIDRLPQVQDARRVARMLLVPVDRADRPIPDKAGSTVALWSERWPQRHHEIVLAGRLPHQDRADEAVVNEEAAAALKARVGTVLRFRGIEPAQLEQAIEGDIPDPSGPIMGVRVVGIVRSLADLHVTPVAPVIYAGNASVALTKAFYERHHDDVAAFPVGAPVSLRHGARDVPALTASVARIAGPDSFVGAGSDDIVVMQQAQRAVSVEAHALWAFSALAALIGLVLVGQALSRLLWLAAQDDATLAALGMSRRELLVVALVRPALVAAGGALVAVVVAVAVSPLFPVGLARRAEVDPGIHLDRAALAVGGLATAALVFLWSLGPAWARSGAAVGRHRDRGGARRSTLVDTAVRWGAGPAAVAGVSLAVQREVRNAGTNPARAGFFHATFAVAAVCAAATFAASLGRFVDVRSRHGWTWDAVVGNPHSEQDVAAGSEPKLRANPGVAEFSALAGAGGEGVEIGGVPVQAIGVSPLKGRTGPAIVEGRPPEAPGEIALGGKVLRTLHAGVGDRVKVAGSAGRGTVLVVGRTVVAPGIVNDQIDLGSGAVLTLDGLRRFVDAPVTQYLVRLAPSERAAALRQLRRDFPNTVLTDTNSAEVANLARVRTLPMALAGMVSVLACATVFHVLVSSVRRRRRDLAVLKTVGFDPRQLRNAVRWQSLLLVAAAAVVGTPLGVAAGRVAWAAVEHTMAVESPPAVPLAVIAGVWVTTVVVALAAAALPGRKAARIPAAVVLRAA